MNNERGIAFNSALWSLAAILVIIAAGYHILREMRGSPEKFETPFQAILLSNGSVYFGHLQGYGTNHPVLTDVYYVVSQTDPATKQVNSILIKRGKELHAPDRMYLTPGQLIFVEPVGKDSKVAQLIAQAEH